MFCTEYSSHGAVTVVSGFESNSLISHKLWLAFIFVCIILRWYGNNIVYSVRYERSVPFRYGTIVCVPAKCFIIYQPLAEEFAFELSKYTYVCTSTLCSVSWHPDVFTTLASARSLACLTFCGSYRLHVYMLKIQSNYESTANITSNPSYVRRLRIFRYMYATYG